jgi:outer membrane receptor protein involved in Fe transport
MIAIVSALGAPTWALAQSTDATLSGTVVDDTGSVLPDVTVAITNAATGLRRQVTTNGDGFYTFPLLQPARYVLTASRKGFAPAEIPDLTLNVNDRLVLKLQLKIAAANETVSVSADAAHVSASPSVATTVDRQFVENLPLNGRSFQSLFDLTPGLVATRTTSNEPGAFSVNGQRTTANYVTIDGVSANVSVSTLASPGQQSAGTLMGGSALGGTNSLVSVDALEELKIQTSGYAPEFGRTPGAQVSVVTRSGTNRFTGSVSEYYRNNALDANDWFGNALSLPQPKLRQHDYGGVFGGPLRRDSTFFFVSYEGIRLDQPKVAIRETPTLETRAAAIPAMRPYLNAFPLPTGPVGTDGLAPVYASYSDPSSLDSTSVRVDQHVGTRATFFGRVNYSPSTAQQRAYATSAVTNEVTRSIVRTTTVTGGSTITLSPHALVDVRANWTRNEGGSDYWIDDLGGAVPLPDSLEFPSYASSANGLFYMSIGIGGNPFIGIGKNVLSQQHQANVIGSLSLLAGTHAFKFGTDIRRMTPVYGPRIYDMLAIFRTIPGVIAGTAATASIASDVGSREQIFDNYSAFAQDTWQANRRLTLTYGIRWDHNPAPHSANGIEPYTAQGIDNWATASLAPPGTPLYTASAANFAPRVGVAYQLSDAPGREMMLRGSSGLFYDLGTAAVGNIFGSNLPYRLSTALTNVQFPLSPENQARPTTIAPPYTLTAYDPHLKLPRTWQWNASLERALGGRQTITVTYLGAAGRDLIRRSGMANPNPQLMSLGVYDNTGSSDYEALQLQYQRRLSHGLQALLSYTFSKSLDNVSNDLLDVTNTTTPGAFGPAADRGPSLFDVRHAASGALTWQLPSPSRGGALAGALNDWAVDLIGMARSPLPANVASFRVTSYGNFTLRPDLVPGVPIYLHDPSYPGGERINPAAFTVPTASRQGTLGRDSLRGLPVWQIDLALRKTFVVPGADRARVQLRLEMFNIFNHPNFDLPNTTIGNNSFGLATQMLNAGLAGGGAGSALSAQYQIGGPRSMQAVVKVQF